jgi:hypothetical protein
MMRFLLVLFLQSMACLAEELPLKSGVYEGLMLAVNNNGEVTGYFNGQQGQGVEKGCSFYLRGTSAVGQINIVTWQEKKLPGFLKPATDGVVLHLPNGRSHPGCQSVLLPQIDQGLAFDLTVAGTWQELIFVQSAKAHLYKEPDEAKKMKSYLVKGDVVGVLAYKDGWVSVEYVSGTKTLRAWVRAIDVASLNVPD